MKNNNLLKKLSILVIVVMMLIFACSFVPKVFASDSKSINLNTQNDAKKKITIESSNSFKYQEIFGELMGSNSDFYLSQYNLKLSSESKFKLEYEIEYDDDLEKNIEQILEEQKATKSTLDEFKSEFDKFKADVDKKNKKELEKKKYDTAIKNSKFALEEMSKVYLALSALKTEDPDTFTAAKTVIEEAINIAAFACGAEGIAKPLFDVIDASMKGSPTISETDLLKQELKYMLESMSDNINSSFARLSKQMDDSTEVIRHTIIDEINKQTFSNNIKEFFSPGIGNFSYDNFKNAVLGSSKGKENALGYNTAYLDKVRRAIEENKSKDEIDQAYQNFYIALTTDSNLSNYNTLFTYLLGSSTGTRPVIQEYYDYLKAYNAYLDYEYPQTQALNFLYEMYVLVTTAANALVTTAIELDLPDFEDLYDSVIEKQRLLEIQLLKDICYILELDKTYLVEDSLGKIQEENDKGQDSYGQVIKGQKVYLYRIADEIATWLDIDPRDIYYRVQTNAETYDCDGEIIISTDGIVTATMMYGDIEIASQIFVVQDEESTVFCGGDGTAYAPYGIHNIYQLQNIKNDLEACYKLVGNVDVSNKTIVQIRQDFDDGKQFNGSLDGQGFYIGGSKDNLGTIVRYVNSVDGTPQFDNNGLFAEIGEYGEVSNLVLKFISNSYEVATSTGTQTFNTGMIAGTNYGTIYNCRINNCSIDIAQSSSVIDEIYNATLNTGGFVGLNMESAVIQACAINDSSIKATSYRFFGSNNPESNHNNAYTGGICAINYGLLDTCLSNTISLYTQVTSEVNYEGTRYPRIESVIGGISAHNLGSLNKIYVHDISINLNDSQERDKLYDAFNKNEGGAKVNEKYCWGLYSIYIAPLASKFEKLKKPNYNTFELLAVVVSPISYFIVKDHYDDQQKEYIAKRNKIMEDYEAEVEQYVDELLVFPAFVDNYTIASTDVINVGSGVVSPGLDGEKTIKVNNVNYTAKLESYYQFDSNNPSLTSTKIGQLYGIYACEIDGTIQHFKLAINYTVAKNHPYKIYFNEDPNLSNIGKDKDPIIEKADLTLEYENGNKEIISVRNNVFTTGTNNTDVSNKFQMFCDTSKLGTSTLYLSYGNIILSYVINIECNHEHLNYVLHPTNCTHKGYRLVTCDDCGYTYIDYNNFRDEHDELYEFSTVGQHIYNRDEREGGTITINQKTESCSEYGYTGDKVCAECYSHGEIVVLEQGRVIAKSDHTYTHDDNTHTCSVCNHTENHHYKVSQQLIEGTYYYVYTCVECGHEIKDNNITIANIDEENTPAIIVSDGYGLKGGDLVTVYVQILNNPGISGATFGVKYDDRLQWVSHQEGSVVEDVTFSSDKVKTSNDDLSTNIRYFLWASTSTISDNGNLLKIVFKLPENARKGDRYDISVVYAMGHGIGGFALATSSAQKVIFLTKPGQIKVVEHLPGDVYEDDKVDILDIYKYAEYIMDSNVEINRTYADVNLDGNVDISDLVSVMRSLIGGYGSPILSPEFQVILETMGGEYEAEAIDVTYGGKYEGLTNPTREGYTFLGWYPYPAGTLNSIGGQSVSKITSNSLVSYYYFQTKQTLYAHWAINKVVLTNGEQSLEYSYSTSVESVSLAQPESFEKTFTANYYVDGEKKIEENHVFTLFGWKDQYGNEYSTSDIIDLRINNNSSTGELILSPIWGLETRGNYEFTVADLVKSKHVLKGYSLSDNSEVINIRQGEKYVIHEGTNQAYFYSKWDSAKYQIVYFYGENESEAQVIDLVENNTTQLRDASILASKVKKYEEPLKWKLSEDVFYEFGSDIAHLTETNGVTIRLELVVQNKQYSISYVHGYPDNEVISVKGAPSFDNVTNITYDTSFTLPSKTFYGWRVKKWKLGNIAIGNPGDTINIRDCLATANINVYDNTDILLKAEWEYVSLADLNANANLFVYSMESLKQEYYKGKTTLYIYYNWSYSNLPDIDSLTVNIKCDISPEVNGVKELTKTLSLTGERITEGVYPEFNFSSSGYIGTISLYQYINSSGLLSITASWSSRTVSSDSFSSFSTYTTLS